MKKNLWLIVAALAVIVATLGCETSAQVTPAQTPCPTCPTCPTCPAVSCPQCTECPACLPCPACPEPEVPGNTVEASRSTEEVVRNLVEALTELGYEARYLEEGIASNPSLVVTTSDGIKAYVGYYHYNPRIQRLVIHIAWDIPAPNAEIRSRYNDQYNLFGVISLGGNLVLQTSYPVSRKINIEDLVSYLDWLGEESIDFIERERLYESGTSS